MSAEPVITHARCPVAFDHDSPEHAKKWEQEYRELRETCPRVWTDSHNGYWVATKHKDVVAIAQEAESFTAHKDYNHETGEVKGGVLIPPLPTTRGMPNETESPEWESVRTFLNPRFSPKAVEQRRSRAKQFAAALIDMVIEKGEFDIVDDFTSPLPALVIMDVFGFRLNEWREFADRFHQLIYTPKEDPAFPEIVKGLEYYRQRVDEEVALRREAPTDDLLSHLANGTINGEPLSRDMIQDMAFNILAGGVDTTTALTANTLLYLSRHPDQRQRLIDDPKLMPYAREEFVRYFSPIQGLARSAREDVVLDDWDFTKGDRVLLAYASANRDPDVFERAEEVVLDRFPNRHIGFGAGMHRCLGSFLARMMFETMIGEVLTRLPDYKVIDEDIRRYPSIAIVNGLINLPATFPPGRKVGAVIA